MPADAMHFARRARGSLRRLLVGPALPSADPPRVLALEDIAAQPRERVEATSRALASPVYLGDGIALCRVLTRYKFFVSTKDIGFGANVLLDGYWEIWLSQFIARTVRRGTVVIDVGANYGYHALLLADLAGPSGRLLAVEPNPDVARLLRRSLDLNGFSQRSNVCEFALGAAEGRAILAIPPGEPKNASTVAGETADDWERREVQVRPLDALVAGAGPIGFIKIDAEGAEEAIIEGMPDTLAARPPMVLEFNAARYADPGAFLERLLRVYGRIAHVGYDGRAEGVSPQRVLTEHFGEDWLLVFGVA